MIGDVNSFPDQQRDVVVLLAVEAVPVTVAHETALVLVLVLVLADGAVVAAPVAVVARMKKHSPRM